MTPSTSKWTASALEVETTATTTTTAAVHHVEQHLGVDTSAHTTATKASVHATTAAAEHVGGIDEILAAVVTGALL